MLAYSSLAPSLPATARRRTVAAPGHQLDHGPLGQQALRLAQREHQHGLLMQTWHASVIRARSIHVSCTSASSSGSNSTGSGTQAPTSQQLVTCKRCFTRFSPQENSKESCRYHSAIYSGGEVAKAIGFVRASDAPEDQLKAVIGKQGLLQFWDCCGEEAEDAPGCERGFHVTWDDELNERMGWTKRYGS